VSQDWKAAGSITVTQPIIPECLVPQYSAQKRWYFPGLVAWNHMVAYRPGTASFFMRKAGT
jgi:hypothetical protein